MKEILDDVVVLYSESNDKNLETNKFWMTPDRLLRYLTSYGEVVTEDGETAMATVLYPLSTEFHNRLSSAVELNKLGIIFDDMPRHEEVLSKFLKKA